MVQARVVGRGLWADAQFELLKLVGSGKISNVYQARPCPAQSLRLIAADGNTRIQACCIRSSTVVALKVYPKVCKGRGAKRHLVLRTHSRAPLPKKSLSELNQVQVQRELDIHSRLHHANVLELYAVFEDADAFYFAMQCENPFRVPCHTRSGRAAAQVRPAR